VVKSLLYFARKDLQEEASIDVNALVKEMTQLLSYTTLKRIRLEMDLQEPLGRLRGDAGALSHALMNLCVNALDAMPETGKLTLGTCVLATGEVELRVSDTGTGMTKEVLDHALDPFFTTKPTGKGTGLGLAMVFGTVKAHRGTLSLHSEPGAGTTVVLRFPAVNRALPSMPAEPQASASVPRALRLFLVDDDELVRMSVKELIEQAGHSVEEARSGIMAVERLEAGLQVDVVVLDFNMPGWTGAETLRRLRLVRPSLPVILASGYLDEEVQSLLSRQARVTFLAKPFSLMEFNRTLEGLLEGPPEA
jgi:CheY-like chemotaxis protein